MSGKIAEASYWFFRYRQDKILPDGSIKTTRKFHIIAPSRGEGAITKKQAEIRRDEFLAGLNAAPTRAEAAVAAKLPDAAAEPDQIIFGKLAELWRQDYVEKIAAGRPLVAAPTRVKYAGALENHILPRWKDARLADLRARVVLEWLQDEATSWHMMSDLRGVMSGIITKAHRMGDPPRDVRQSDPSRETAEKMGGARKAHLE